MRFVFGCVPCLFVRTTVGCPYKIAIGDNIATGDFTAVGEWLAPPAKLSS